MDGARGGWHWAWLILATCFVNLFINYSARLGYGVVLPEMIRDWGITRAQAGSIYNAYLFTYVLVTPLTGYLTDRLGARVVIAVCALVLSLGLLLMGTAPSLPRACAFYAVVGLGSTGMWTPVVTVVQRWFAPERRGLALGVLATGYGLGFATMGAAFPVIVGRFSWRHAWFFLGAAAAAMAAVNLLLLRRSPESTGRRPWGSRDLPAGPVPAAPARENDRPDAGFFRDPNFWIIGASYFCIAYALYGLTTFMVDYGRNQVGLPLEKASLLATIHGFGQVAGVLTILPLSDYLGRQKTVLLSNGGICLALTAILFSGGSPVRLFLLVGLLAVFFGATFPLYGACAGDYFPRRVMGTVIGAWTPFYGAGAILVHWVGGHLRDVTGRYDLTFALNAALAGLAVLFFIRVRRRRNGLDLPAEK
ncbi:MAG: MFS transporter [Thermodesulfobacteriota bacterium]